MLQINHFMKQSMLFVLLAAFHREITLMNNAFKTFFRLWRLQGHGSHFKSPDCANVIMASSNGSSKPPDVSTTHYSEFLSRDTCYGRDRKSHIKA